MSARTPSVEQDTERFAPGARRRGREGGGGRVGPGRPRWSGQHHRSGRQPRPTSATHHRAGPREVDARPAGPERVEATLEQPAVPAGAAPTGAAVPRGTAAPVAGAPTSMPDAPALVGMPAPSGGGTTDGGRRAVREARRHRRRVAWACVVVVAACLVATVVVLGVARDRRPPRPAGIASAVTLPVHPTTNPGVSAPGGGKRT